MRIFISAVTADFAVQRQRLAERLRAEGHEVDIQEDFDTGGPDGLLSQLHDAIAVANLVVALLSDHGGTAVPSSTVARRFDDIRRDWNFTIATITQWEVYFALHWGKTVVALGPKSLFQHGAVLADETQRRLIAYFKDVGKFYEWASPRLPGASSDRVIDAMVREAFKRVQFEIDHLTRDSELAEFPTLARHADYLRVFAAGRLADAANLDAFSAESTAGIDGWFVSRVAISKRHEGRQIRLPIDIIRAAEAFANGQRKVPMRQLLLVGRAGDGKTTVINQLLQRFAVKQAIAHYKLVPVLANCITLSFSFGRTPDQEAIANWLRLAIVPQASGADRSQREADDLVERFVDEVRTAGYALLILVDGLDELDPSGKARGALAKRLLSGLERWRSDQRLTDVFYIATTRPEEEIEAWAPTRGLDAFELAPPSREELVPLIERLLAPRTPGEQPPSAAMIERLIVEFQNTEEINSSMVYLPLLASYYRTYPEEAASQPITRRHLMELETSSIVRKILLDLETQPGHDTSHTAIERRIREVLLEIAIRSLNPYDREVPLRHERSELANLQSVKAVPGLSQLVTGEKLAHRLLHVLVYDTRHTYDGAIGFHYRLPHNEHRDYLLAKGLFDWIQQSEPQDAPYGMSNALAAAYLGAQRVRPFMDAIISQAFGATAVERRWPFARRLAALMNDVLPGEAPAQRSAASPHGALLSLLLRLGSLPESLQVNGSGKNFQGTWFEASGSARVRFPLDPNCQKATFRESILRGADLSAVNFDGADFDNADLKGASLAGASLVGANLRNVAMGEFHQLATRLTDANLAAADLFNYRFQGLKGYYTVWDLEVVGRKADERYVLAAGSRGQILAFDLTSDGPLEPIVLQTEARGEKRLDEILDISRHPLHQNVIVTTGRDSTVRILRIPDGAPSEWPQRLAADGTAYAPIREVGYCDLTEKLDTYPRRAQFSASGIHLALITRDQGVVFFQIAEQGDLFTFSDPPVLGLEHSGPVMCIVADRASTTGDSKGVRAADRFFTAGYDGRLAVWRESIGDGPAGWKRARATSTPRAVERTNKREVDIFRALLPSRSGRGLWAGTELNGTLEFYTFVDGTRDATGKSVYDAGQGVFALALEGDWLAAGLADGQVIVFKQTGTDTYDWQRPVFKQQTSREIVRSLQFIKGGRELLAATWDACLFRFDVPSGRELARYEYPQAKWRPADDVMQIEFDGDPLASAEGISTRMRDYLQRVQRARQQSS